ncbi:hypothetical protein V8E36_008744 [Tilletia maclaganii]
MPTSRNPQRATLGGLGLFSTFFDVAATRAARIDSSGKLEMLTEWAWTWERLSNFYGEALTGEQFRVRDTHAARVGTSGEL